jgi:hypothetical protein
LRAEMGHASNLLRYAVLAVLDPIAAYVITGG